MNRGYLYLGFTAFVFGTFEVVTKLIHGVEATQMNFLRFLIGGLSLLPFALREIRRRQIRLGVRDLASLALLGTLFVSVAMVLYQIGLDHSSASLVIFIFSASPVFTAFFALLVLREVPNRLVLLGILLGMAGVALITNPFGRDFNVYTLFSVAGLVLFALYNVLMRPMTGRLGNTVATALSLVFGTAVLFVVQLLRGAAFFQGVGGRNLLPILYVGIFCSGLTYVSYYKGMGLTSTNTGSIVFFFKPILGTALAVLLLGETVSLRFAVSAGLILLGSVVMIYGKERVPAGATGAGGEGGREPDGGRTGSPG